MSQYYFINANGEQVGPFEVQQLKSMGVTSKTYVWKEGMSDWVMAERVGELAPLFVQISNPRPYPNPNPSPTPYPNPSSNVKPNSWLWLGICTTLLCCLPLGIVSIVYASKVDSCWATGNHSEAINNSNKARNWGIASAASGLVVFILYIFFVVLLSI